MDDNSSVTAAFNSTVALKTTSARETVAMVTTATVSLVVGIVGSSANGIVLTVLVRARRQFGSSVHSLIVNQSAMDLFACFFAMISIVVMLTHGTRYDDKQILEAVLCVLFGGGALTATSATAEKIGLAVITLERYFKIDQAIAHRSPGFFQRCGLETIILVSRPQMLRLGLRLERRSPGGLGCCGLGLGLVLGLEHCDLGLEGCRFGPEIIGRGLGLGLNLDLGLELGGLALGIGLDLECRSCVWMGVFVLVFVLVLNNVVLFLKVAVLVLKVLVVVLVLNIVVLLLVLVLFQICGLGLGFLVLPHHWVLLGFCAQPICS